MKKFLIADDSNFMRQMIKNILVESGHTVIGEADNGRVAVEKYKELSPDIVTLDISMDEMNGLDALRAIINHDQHANVLMVSAIGGQDWIINEALESGAKGVITKPFKKPAVLNALKKLL